MMIIGGWVVGEVGRCWSVRSKGGIVLKCAA